MIVVHHNIENIWYCCVHPAKSHHSEVQSGKIEQSRAEPFILRSPMCLQYSIVYSVFTCVFTAIFKASFFKLLSLLHLKIKQCLLVTNRHQLIIVLIRKILSSGKAEIWVMDFMCTHTVHHLHTEWKHEVDQLTQVLTISITAFICLPLTVIEHIMLRSDYQT